MLVFYFYFSAKKYLNDNLHAQEKKGETCRVGQIYEVIGDLVSFSFVGSVGIVQLIASQMPFGATRRVVYESNCHTCSENDLKNLEYHWQLGEIMQGFVEEEQVEQMEMKDYRGMLRRGCAGFECLKSGKRGKRRWRGAKVRRRKK